MLDRIKIAYTQANEEAKGTLSWEQLSPAWRLILMSVYLSGKEDSVDQVNAMIQAKEHKLC